MPIFPKFSSFLQDSIVCHKEACLRMDSSSVQLDFERLRENCSKSDGCNGVDREEHGCRTCMPC